MDLPKEEREGNAAANYYIYNKVTGQINYCTGHRAWVGSVCLNI